MINGPLISAVFIIMPVFHLNKTQIASLIPGYDIKLCKSPTVEVPVNYKDRPEGSVSKLNTVKDGLKVLKTIATLFKEYKPAIFFNIVATIVLLVSIIMAVPVFVEYFQTGLVPKYPTLIVSGIFLVISLLLYAVGIILQVIVKKHRQLFEILLNQTDLIKKQQREDAITK